MDNILDQFEYNGKFIQIRKVNDHFADIIVANSLEEQKKGAVSCVGSFEYPKYSVDEKCVFIKSCVDNI